MDSIIKLRRGRKDRKVECPKDTVEIGLDFLHPDIQKHIPNNHTVNVKTELHDGYFCIAVYVDNYKYEVVEEDDYGVQHIVNKNTYDKYVFKYNN